MGPGDLGASERASVGAGRARMVGVDAEALSVKSLHVRRDLQRIDPGIDRAVVPCVRQVDVDISCGQLAVEGVLNS
jgi:hypothetical protein